MAEWVVEDSDLEDADVWDGPWEDEPSLQGALLEVERFVFWAAFSIRKLIESKKLSDDFEALTFSVRRHPGRTALSGQDWLNSHHFDRHYDLGRYEMEEMGSLRLCNQLIHSVAFVPVTDEAGRVLEGILFNSDRTRSRCLYAIEWTEFDRMVMEAVDDDINELDFDRRTQTLVKRRRPAHDGAPQSRLPPPDSP
jgi:hypothetical protein